MRRTNRLSCSKRFYDRSFIALHVAISTFSFGTVKGDPSDQGELERDRLGQLIERAEIRADAKAQREAIQLLRESKAFAPYLEDDVIKLLPRAKLESDEGLMAKIEASPVGTKEHEELSREAFERGKLLPDIIEARRQLVEHCILLETMATRESICLLGYLLMEDERAVTFIGDDEPPLEGIQMRAMMNLCRIDEKIALKNSPKDKHNLEKWRDWSRNHFKEYGAPSIYISKGFSTYDKK